MFNEAGQLAISYNLFRCWVSEYTALPQLDAATAAVAIRSIKIEMESWSRDVSVTEPKELSV
jgi:phage tail-like protein